MNPERFEDGVVIRSLDHEEKFTFFLLLLLKRSFFFLPLCSSSKCQILHWRRGHKEECRSPSLPDYDREEDKSVESDGNLTLNT